MSFIKIDTKTTLQTDQIHYVCLRRKRGGFAIFIGYEQNVIELFYKESDNATFIYDSILDYLVPSEIISNEDKGYYKDEDET